MINSDIKNLVVLDAIKETLEMVDSDILPQSESHPIVSGIENVPSQLISRSLGQWTNTFTTFPLSPLEGRVHYIKDSFLHFKFTINFGITVVNSQSLENVATSYIYLAIGPRDTSSIFNQLTLLMDNNTIWNTSYHHIESAISLAALPASVIDHNPNYATIDKLLAGKNTPMQIIRLDASVTTLQQFQLKYDLTIDLNRLCVPLSNIQFITSNMGNLRLKVYINDIANAFYYFVLPPSVTSFVKTPTANLLNMQFSTNSLLCLNPVIWNASSTSNINYLEVPMYATQAINIDGTSSQVCNTFATAKLAFVANASDIDNTFITFDQADICQTCFDLEEDGWSKLCEYFASIGKVILPAQQFSTTAFNNGDGNFTAIGTNTSAFSLPLVGFAPGNNITDVILTFPVQNHLSCLVNPYFRNVQCLLDGKPINNTPYEKIAARAITDFTNACIDTDNEEINTDYLYSLQFPPYINISTSTSVDDSTYFFDNMLNEYTHRKFNLGVTNSDIKNANLFMMVFQTGIPDSFHTGAAISEFSQRQTMIRLTGSTYNTNDINNYLMLRDGGTGAIVSSTYYTDATIYNCQFFPTPANIQCGSYISTLCDVCIVLDYNASFNSCTSGYISYAKPYLADE